MAGLDIPETTSFISSLKKVGAKTSFLWRKTLRCHGALSASDIDHIELTNNIQSYQAGSLLRHLFNIDENIMKLADATRTSRVMVNQPQAASNSGNLWNGILNLLLELSARGEATVPTTTSPGEISSTKHGSLSVDQPKNWLQMSSLRRCDEKAGPIV